MTRRGVALWLLVLAAGLRLYKVEAWSFAGDELATVQETRVLFEGAPADPEGQKSKLPRLVPAGYAVQYLGYAAFGDSEFGTRLPSVIVGSLLAPLATLLLWTLLGRWPATATGLLLAMWPDAIFHSQENRFYMSAGFVAGACMMLAAVGLEGLHRGVFAVACGFGVVAPFFHPVLAVLAPGLLATAFLGVSAGRRPFLILAGITCVIVGCEIVFYHLPLVRGWNADARWGYPVGHAIMGGVKRVGLPNTAFAIVGLILMLQSGHRTRRVWVVWFAMWAGSLCVLPFVVTYHPAYSFPFAVAPMVLAGYAIGEAGRRLPTPSGGIVSVILVGAFCVMDLPALVSYYADGSRHDYRAAARFVASVRKPDEKVLAYSPANLGHYEESLANAEALDPNRLLTELNALVREGRPVWLVLPEGRNRRYIGVENWLNHYAKLKRTFRKTRFDYDDYTVDVYKFEVPG